MRIIGHGIDMVEISRIEEILARHEERFLERVYVPSEIARAAGDRRRTEHLAGRFAAKEAVLKALGTGLAMGLSWTEIEIGALPSGQPEVLLRGAAERHARGLGIETWHISISHTEQFASASVIACGA